MPDEISTPPEKEANVTPTPAPVPAKPKKKKAPAKKKVAPLAAEIKPQVKSASKPILKKAEKKPKAESSLLFSQERPERKPERKPSGGAGAKFMGAVVVAVLLLGGAFYAWSKTQQAVSQSERTATDLRAQVDGEVSGIKDRLQQIADELQAQKQKQETAYQEYRNDEIGIVFRYPQNLGQVQAQAEDVKGKKTISLTFSSNPDLWLVASVADNKSTNAFVYDGGDSNLAASCKEPLAVSSEGYCDLLVVLGSQTVERVRPIGEDALLNVVKTVPINLPGAYKGLTVNVGLGLPPVTGRDLFAAPDEKELDAALEQFFRNLIKREQMSLVVQENLSAFQTILTGMQVIAAGS